jgi:glycine C-acetyltransferase
LQPDAYNLCIDRYQPPTGRGAITADERERRTMSTAAWTHLDPRIDQTVRRVAELEHDGARRHSFVEYVVRPTSPVVEVGDRELLMMSGYSYLGLNGDERVVRASQDAVARYGTGSHGVRPLAGSIPLHAELEAAVARFAGREAAIVFSSGYAANVGTAGALVGPGDTVFLDKIDHASIVDGCQLSGAEVVRFRHNDPQHLEARLRSCGTGGVRLVIVDSVYSMDGDIAPLVALRDVCDRHDALLMVDEAHALGVIGSTGRGIEEHYGWSAEVDVKLGTLSKAIPSIGGWVAGSADLIRHLRYKARPFVFSASLPPGQAAAALESLRILQAEPERVTHTQKQAARLREIVAAAGLDVRQSETAVIPLIAGSDERAYEYATACFERGVVALPVVSPAVPSAAARLRIAVTACHAEADIDKAAEVFVDAARACGII